MPAGSEVVLAHYGGVPEAMTIGVPVAIFAGFLLMEKRARRRERQRAGTEAEPATDAGRDSATGPSTPGPGTGQPPTGAGEPG